VIVDAGRRANVCTSRSPLLDPDWWRARARWFRSACADHRFHACSELCTNLDAANRCEMRAHSLEENPGVFPELRESDVQLTEA
jgi:hypothetical protein